MQLTLIRASVIALTLTLFCHAEDGPKSDVVPKVEVGKAAPDFVATGIDGKSFRLSEKLKNGKSIALMFSRAHW